MTELGSKSTKTVEERCALVALGANLPVAGDTPEETLENALACLQAHPNIEIASVSRWYQTPAYPPGSGPDFCNGAAALRTTLAPEALLSVLHQVEADLGRERNLRWGPRVCDLDLLAMGDLVLPDAETLRSWMALSPEQAAHEMPEQLLLPHPRLQDRAFVLAPLAEIAPLWRHPLIGATVSEMLAALGEDARAEITPISDSAMDRKS